MLTMLAAKIFWKINIASLGLAGLSHIQNVNAEFSINFQFFSRCDNEGSWHQTLVFQHELSATTAQLS